MADVQKTTDHPRSDAGWWLYEYQKLTANVLWMVANGQSETAVKEMLAIGGRWRDAND